MGDRGVGGPIEDFTDLRVWHTAMDLVEQVSRLTRDVPRHELYGLTSQMQRAAVSIPSNVAEGQSRGHLTEDLHHVSVARGSVAELRTQIEIAGRPGYLTRDQAAELRSQAIVVARQLTSLRNSLAARDTQSPNHPSPRTTQWPPSPSTN